MLYTLFPIHSFIRWLIIIIAVAAIIKFAIGWLRGGEFKGEFKGMDRGLAAGFSGLIDLQATLGLIMLVGLGRAGEGFPMVRIEHTGTMLLAIVLAHLPARWKKAEDKIRFRNTLFCILGTLLLIYVGVGVLPVGWGN